jgi:hypothetical protein
MRGGARPGSGRKKGSVSKATQKRRADAIAAAQAGVTPLEVMLKRMRFHYERAEQFFADGSDEALKAVASELEQAGDAAKDAAPYVHPRLATLTDPKGTGPITVVIRQFAFSEDSGEPDFASANAGNT